MILDNVDNVGLYYFLYSKVCEISDQDIENILRMEEEEMSLYWVHGDTGG